MRRRTAPIPTSTDTPPAELLVGALAEVWAPGDLLAARRRWNDARTEWLRARGLDVATGCRVIPAGGPWSLAEMQGDGRAAWSESRLTRAGVTLADLPDLARAAEQYPDRSRP